MAVLFDSGIFSVVSSAGAPLAGALLYWYTTGTVTPLATYSDSALSVPNANPVVADADGRFPAIWLQNANYKMILKTAAGVTLVTRDPISGDDPLVALASASGAGEVGFSQSSTYAAGTLGLHEQSFVSITDAPFNAKCDGTTNDAAAINAALSSGAKRVYANVTSFKTNSNVVIPAGVEFIGCGINGTTWIVGADVVGARVLSYAKLQGFRFQFPGGHTQNGVEAGDLTNFADRAVLQDLYIAGAGNDGIQVRNGNCGTIRDVTCASNGRDGINFTIETNNNNAWKLEGHLDLRGNRDGLHLSAGSSATDSLAPKTNSGDLIIVQNNTRYGVYCGTRSNKMVIYSEANTTADIFLDTYAYGNDVTILEAGTFTDNGTANLVTTQNADADYKRAFRGQPRFQGGTGKGWMIDNSDGAVGRVSYEKTAASQFDLIVDGTSATQTTRLRNAAGGAFKHNLDVDGTVTASGPVAGSSLAAANTLILTGAGSPASVVAAPLGSLYLNTSGGAGTTLYVKEAGTNGSTGWAAK